MESNFVESVWNQFTQAEEMTPSSLPAEEMTSSSSSLAAELEDEMGGLSLENNIRPHITNTNRRYDDTNRSKIPVEEITSSSLPVEEIPSSLSLAAELEDKMGDLSLENNIQPHITNTNTSYGDTNRDRVPENKPQGQQHHLQFHRHRLRPTQLRRQQVQQCRRHHHRLQDQQSHGYHHTQQHHGHILRLWGPQYLLPERHGRFNFRRLHHHHHLHPHQRRYHGHPHPQSQLQVPSHVSMGTCPLASLGFTNRSGVLNQNETNRIRALAMSDHNRQQLLQQRRSMATRNSGILRSIGNDFENTQHSDDQETLLHNEDIDLNSDIIRLVTNMLIANDSKNKQESDDQETPLHNDDIDDDIDMHNDDIGI